MGKKTFNDLAEEFQWVEGMDPDHIFEGEMEMIRQLRAEVPQLADENDKFVAAFLFARRHDIKQVKELLEAFYKKKAELNFGEHAPSFRNSAVMQNTPNLGGVPQVHFKGFRDNHGRMLRTFWLGQEDSSKRTLEYTYTFWYFQVYYLLDTEPLNAWRNGICLCVDLKGFGWKNLDVSAKGREASAALQGLFPYRIRAIYAYNGGAIVYALVKAAKLVLPKKFMERVKLVDVKELKNLIPPKYLLSDYGGECKMTLKDYENEMLNTEAELYNKGIRQESNGAESACLRATPVM